MIIDVKPRVTDVFLQVWRTLAVLFVWDVLVTIIYYVLPFRAPALPLTIFGSALALFLGFRANSTYQRWWEGRPALGTGWRGSCAASRCVRLTRAARVVVAACALAIAAQVLLFALQT